MTTGQELAISVDVARASKENELVQRLYAAAKEYRDQRDEALAGVETFRKAVALLYHYVFGRMPEQGQTGHTMTLIRATAEMREQMEEVAAHGETMPEMLACLLESSSDDAVLGDIHRKLYPFTTPPDALTMRGDILRGINLLLRRTA